MGATQPRTTRNPESRHRRLPGGPGTLTVALPLQHQTAAQFAARFWDRVRAARASGNLAEWERLIWWVWSKVQAGDLTNDQVRVSFNAAYGRSLTLAQWNTLVSTRLVPIKDRYLARIAEADL